MFVGLCRMSRALLLLLCACAHTAPQAPLSLRAACPDDATWDGKACQPRGDGAKHIADGADALASFNVDGAKKALDAAETSGRLAHDANVRLWEQRGIAAAYVDDEAGARAAFDMMLALDPAHFLSYRLSPKATFVFDDMRAAKRVAPALELDLPHGEKVGDPLPIEIGVVADPKQFLRRGTLFVRARGETSWRAADIALGTDTKIVIPPVVATKPVSLELYLRAYDDKGNETLVWADPEHPREIPLRYEPPAPWYRKWWVIPLAAAVVASATGFVVYEETLAPPDKVTGSATVH